MVKYSKHAFLYRPETPPMSQKEWNSQTIQAGVISNGFFLNFTGNKYILKDVERSAEYDRQSKIFFFSPRMDTV